MDLNLKAALGQPARTFTAVRAELPDGDGTYVLRLLNGGQAVLDGETFTGRDDRFGALSSMGTISDGVDSQASTLSVILNMATDEGLELLANARAQGSPFTIRQGAIDTDTGGVFGTELLFTGELNHAVLIADEETRALRLDLITEEARALEANDDRRLSHAFHQFCWPGEDGLIHATGVTEKDFWRVRRPSISYGSGGGLGSGGGYDHPAALLK